MAILFRDRLAAVRRSLDDAAPELKARTSHVHSRSLACLLRSIASSLTEEDKSNLNTDILAIPWFGLDANLLLSELFSCDEPVSTPIKKRGQMRDYKEFISYFTEYE